MGFGRFAGICFGLGGGGGMVRMLNVELLDVEC